MRETKSFSRKGVAVVIVMLMVSASFVAFIRGGVGERQELIVEAVVGDYDDDSYNDDVIIYVNGTEGNPLPNATVMIDDIYYGETNESGQLMAFNFEEGWHHVVVRYEELIGETDFYSEGEPYSIYVDATVGDYDGNGDLNDVLLHVYDSYGIDIDGAEIYIDGFFFGLTNESGMLIAYNFEEGWHNVTAIYGEYNATTKFYSYGEYGIFVTATVGDYDGDNFNDDVLVYVYDSYGGDVEGAEIYIDNASYGQTDENGELIAYNFEEGWHNVTAIYGEYTAYTEFYSEGEETYIDLMIAPDDIVFSNDNPFEGELVTISATVHNIGTENATEVVVVCLVDKDVIGIEVTDVPAGSESILEFSWTAAGIGNHTVSVVIDPDDLIPESDEENNVANRTIEVVGIIAPDLTVTQLALQRQDGVICDGHGAPPDGVPHPVTLENTTFNATIENIGSEDAFDVVVTFYDSIGRDGTEIGTVIIPFIAQASFEYAVIQHVFEVDGEHNLSVMVDPLNNITESDETNNELFDTIWVIPDDNGYAEYYVTGRVFYDNNYNGEYDEGIDAPIPSADILFTNLDNGESGSTITGEDGTYYYLLDTGFPGSISYNEGDEILISVSYNGDYAEQSFFAYSEDEGIVIDFYFAEQIDVSPTDIQFFREDWVEADNITIHPVANDTTYITATVFNYGNTSALDILIGFYINETEIGNDTIDIPANGSAIAQIEHTFSMHGTYTVTVIADPYDERDELNEENNEYSESIFVKEEFTWDQYIVYGRVYLDVNINDEYDEGIDLNITYTQVTIMNIRTNNTLSVYTDEYGKYQESISNLPAGEDGYPYHDGDTVILSVVYLGNTINVSTLVFSEDGGKELNIPVGVVPDLMLTSDDITFSNENPVDGELIIIYALIHNIGSGNASANVNFYDGDPLTGEFIGNYTVYVPADGTDLALVAWTATLGMHTIYVEITDVYPDEYNTENNIASKEIYVQARPDLTPTEIRFYRADGTEAYTIWDGYDWYPHLVINENSTVEVTVANIGEGNAYNVSVRVYDYTTADLIGSVTVDISSGESVTLSFIWNFTFVGNHTIGVVVDEDNEIFESDETNNWLNITRYIKTDNPYFSIYYIYGTVSLLDGSLLSGVTVEFLNLMSGKSFNTTTDENGFYSATLDNYDDDENNDYMEGDIIEISSSFEGYSDTEQIYAYSEDGGSEVNLVLYVEGIDVVAYDIRFFRADGTEAYTIWDGYDWYPHLVINENSTLMAVLYNYGTDNAENITLQFYDDTTSELLGTVVIQIISSGEMVSTSIQWNFTVVGDHTIRINVSVDGDVYPGNNDYSETHYIKSDQPETPYIIYGTVYDIDGVTPLPFVTVTFENLMSGLILSTTTNETGQYLIILGTDDYEEGDMINVSATDGVHTGWVIIYVYSEDGGKEVNIMLFHFEAGLFCADPDKGLEPGETIVYSIEVTNLGNVEDTIILSISGVPFDWNAYLDVYSVTLMPSESAMFNLTVTASPVMMYSPAGLQALITVTATPFGGIGDPTSLTTITTVLQVYNVSIEVDESIKYLHPGKSIQFNITVINAGNGLDTIHLALYGVPEGWDAGLSRYTVVLELGESAVIILTVTAPINASIGEIALITVTAYANDGFGPADDLLTTSITVNTAPILDIEIPDVGFDEDSSLINAFNLNNHFSDPDLDTLTFTYYGNVHIAVVIKDDGSVDFYAEENWNGAEMITFRATDPYGAFAEFSINVTVNAVNDVPILDKPLPYVEFNEDSSLTNAFNLNDYFIDIDGDALQYTYTGNVNVIVTINGDGFVTFSAVEDWNGAEMITFIADDGNGGTAQDTIMVFVRAVNDAPTVEPIPDVEFLEDSTLQNAFSLDDYFSDIDSELVYFVYGDVNVIVSIDSLHEVTFSALENWNGYENITFVAYDGQYQVSYTITVTVLPDNDGPVLNFPLPDVTFDEDNVLIDAFDLNIYFTDIDGDTLIFNYTGNVNVIVTINDGLVSFSAVENWNGQEEITFTADDGLERTSDTIMVSVRAVNDAPEIAGDIPDVEFDEDSSLTNAFNLNDYFTDVDSELIYFFSGNIHITVVINADNTVDFYAEENWNDQEEITFTAFDGEYKISQTVTVTVIAVNDAPALVLPLPDVTFDEDSSLTNAFNLNTFFTDIDGDPLNFTYSGAEHVIVTINTDGSVDFYAEENWNGQEEITFTADDGNDGTASDSVVVTVRSINDPPVIKGIESTNATEDKEYNATVIADDADAEPLTYYLFSAPEGMSIDSSTGRITWTPTNAQVGENTIVVAVSDGNGGLDTKSFIITVANVNDPPERIKELPDVTFDEDSSLANAFNLNDYFIDIDGDALQYTYSGNVNVIVTISDGFVTFTAEADWNGAEMITFTADDGNGGTAQGAMTVTVNPVPDAPREIEIELSVDADKIFVGKEIGFAVTYEDVDGVGVTATWDFGDNTAIEEGDNVTHTYYSPGEYIVTVTLESDGAVSISKVTINVKEKENNAPTDLRIITPANDATFYVGDAIEFRANATDIDGDILTFEWDFGDDEHGIGSEVQHAYDEKGTYTVTVRVFDEHGATADPATITVNIKEHPPAYKEKPYEVSWDILWWIALVIIAIIVLIIIYLIWKEKIFVREIPPEVPPEEKVIEEEVAPPVEEEEVEEEMFECSNCKTLVSAIATRCPNCGAIFEEELPPEEPKVELKEEPTEEKEEPKE